MYRKLLAALVALFLVVGGLFADEVKGVFKKLDGNKVTVEVDGKATDYKVADVKIKNKKTNTEVALTDVLGKWKEGDKGTFTVNNGEVTKAKKEK